MVWRRLWTRWAEPCGGIALVGLTAFFLRTSWRKWPDPLIDFGRELYLPWRLNEGALLYRDVEDFYGPLSQYLNALLFRLFGPGMMVLVGANLVVFLAIVILIYGLFRRAWGPAAAFLSAGLFISVFAFSQFLALGNYTYAAPYAHEATHGLLVCLALAAALTGGTPSTSPRRALAVGFLCGLTAVLKVEFMLCAGAMTAAAFVVRLRQGHRLTPVAAAAWVAGAALPTVAFGLAFASRVPLPTAFAYAAHGWLYASRLAGSPGQLGFLGLDDPLPRALEHLQATAGALGLFGALAAGARASERARFPWLGLLIAVATCLGLGTLAQSFVPWERAGQALLALTLGYVALCALQLRHPSPRAEPLVIAVLASTLMARMLLNGRIEQFGFYQAALAALLVVAVLWRELPEWLGLKGRGRWVIACGVLSLLGPGVASRVRQSQGWLAAKTYAVGEGPDRFFALPPDVEGTGQLVENAARWLRQSAKGRDQTLLVLPDGIMINYLARMASPVAPFCFLTASALGDAEPALVADLAARPPDWVVLVHRDVREWGFERYGARQGEGKAVIDWVQSHYDAQVTNGADPLDFRQEGVAILARRPPAL